MGGTHRLLEGARFADRFQVDSLLGQGSMANVYAVHALDGGAGGALKVLHPHIMEEDPKAIERFHREVRVGKVIRSEHVVEVLASGVSGEQPWLLMERLDGLTLDAFMAERTVSHRARWVILDQLLGAIALAHYSGVIHRDLKPENILVLDANGGPFIKVLDFGVSKTIRTQDLGTSLTHSGFGTPLWAAPEQGKEGVRLTPSCDIWALGLLTFFVLTTKVYWRHMNIDSASAIDIAMEMLRAPIEPASVRATWLGVAGALPPGFDDWFQHCVSRDAAERFDTAAAAHAALAAVKQ